MRMHGDRRWALVGTALMLVGGAVACGGTGGTSDTGDTGGRGEGASATASATGAVASPRPSGPRFDEEIELSDGRRVGMSYVAGRGLVERHRGAGAGVWSAPHVVYATVTDRCQSLTLKEFGGTVAVIANWGDYCYDGEPPMESIAAVGVGDLSRWDTKLTEEFDGWEKVVAVDDVRELVFSEASTEYLTRLRWSRTAGFAEVEEIPR
ncbi:hypothetical protein SAMN04487983_102095 [Streptomyces sp. yr375]|uniref:hypothetical protein n=1 Tax=Streptomyces sp. yr375 TaxID=1761906 RepID=UPI0008D67601|nr:hypothetical protein [Streptomyces sp. yr375]SER69384.1 hypothetical protein SAMN04487983_102095 [Streptomyces sp. yr375]